MPPCAQEDHLRIQSPATNRATAGVPQESRVFVASAKPAPNLEGTETRIAQLIRVRPLAASELRKCSVVPTACLPWEPGVPADAASVADGAAASAEFVADAAVPTAAAGSRCSVAAVPAGVQSPVVPRAFAVPDFACRTASPVAAGISGPALRCRCWAERGVRRSEGLWDGQRYALRFLRAERRLRARREDGNHRPLLGWPRPRGKILLNGRWRRRAACPGSRKHADPGWPGLARCASSAWIRARYAAHGQLLPVRRSRALGRLPAPR